MTHPFARSGALLEGPILPSLLKLAVPIVFATILQSAYQLTDAFWVGRLGGAAVAAVSVSFPVVFVMIAIGMGFGVAGSTLVAQYVGAGDRRMVNHVAAQTLLMVAITSILLGAIGYAIAPGLLRVMRVGPDVFPGALQFMRVSFISLLVVFGFAMFQAIMRGVGEVTLPVFIVLGTVFLNFALDPLFIFGWGAIPALGVAGAAWATFATQTLAAAIGLAVLLAGRYGIHLHVADFAPDWEYVNRAFRLGLPASLEQSVRGFGMTLMAFLVARFGTVALAAYGVGFNVLTFVVIPAMGLSLATATLVGQHIGAGKVARAEKIAHLSAGIALGGGLLVGAVVFVAAHHIVAFFVPHDPAVIAEGGLFLRLIALSFGLTGAQLAFTGVFRAAGRMVTTMVIAIVSLWVVQLPLAYTLSMHTQLGIRGVWWAIPVSAIAGAGIAFVWFLRGDWKTGRLTAEARLVETVSEEILVEEGGSRP